MRNPNKVNKTKRVAIKI